MEKMNTNRGNYHDTGGGAIKKNVPSGRYMKEFQKEAVNSGNRVRSPATLKDAAFGPFIHRSLQLRVN
jgi:hypothetical protein